MNVEPFDVSDDVVLLVLAFGALFSFLIMGIEMAVGGAVHQAIEMGPVLTSVALVFLFRAGSANQSSAELSGDVSTNDYSSKQS